MSGKHGHGGEASSPSLPLPEGGERRMVAGRRRGVGVKGGSVGWAKRARGKVCRQGEGAGRQRKQKQRYVQSSASKSCLPPAPAMSQANMSPMVRRLSPPVSHRRACPALPPSHLPPTDCHACLRMSNRRSGGLFQEAGVVSLRVSCCLFSHLRIYRHRQVCACAQKGVRAPAFIEVQQTSQPAHDQDQR